MSISRRNPRHCQGCGAQRFAPLFAAFTNGVGWRDLCWRCSEGSEDGPPRAYAGPNPIRPQVTL